MKTRQDTDFELLFEHMARHVDLTPQDMDHLRLLYKPQKIRRREYLIKSGEICKFDYFTTQGCIRSYFVDKNGKEHNLTFAIEGWWTGNLHSFMTRTPSKYTVEALEDAQVLKISNTDIDLLYRRI